MFISYFKNHNTQNSESVSSFTFLQYFTDLRCGGVLSIKQMFERIVLWSHTELSHGCWMKDDSMSTFVFSSTKTGSMYSRTSFHKKLSASEGSRHFIPASKKFLVIISCNDIFIFKSYF